MADDYLTLKLTIGQLGEGRYRARIDRSPRGASRVIGERSDFSASPADVQRWIATAPGGGASRAQIKDVGQELFGLVFKGPVLEKYGECLARCAGESGVFIRIGLAVLPPELVAIPWEYFHDGDSFLIKEGRLILRLIDTLPEKTGGFRPIRRLLIVIANPDKDPKTYHPFDAAKHRDTLIARVAPIAVEKILLDPSRDVLRAVLRDTKADALYFLGHGEHSESLEGQLVLSDGGHPVYLDADILAGMVRESKVRFVYLNSCSSGATGLANVFSGTAQRLMKDGDVDAVIAMQTPVVQDSGLAIAVGFFDELARGNPPEVALSKARMDADDFHSWGVPVVYSYEGGTEDFETNRIACLLGAESGRGRFGFILPSFSMGLHMDGVGEVEVKEGGRYAFPSSVGPVTLTVEPPPPKVFIFPGIAHASDDVGSALDILGLVGRVASADRIELYGSTGQAREVTHWFFFGSRSNQKVADLLKNYSERYQVDYGVHPRWKGKWTLLVRAARKGTWLKYQVDAPSGLGMRDYAAREDFGFIEKIVDEPGGRTFFIIAGLGSRATRGCGAWLAKHWGELVGAFLDRPFGVVLRFPPGLDYDSAEWVNRPDRAGPRA